MCFSVRFHLCKVLHFKNLQKWGAALDFEAFNALYCYCKLSKEEYRGWVPKFATGLIYQIEHGSKSIWVTRLLFFQNDSLIRGSFCPKDSLITSITFELCLIWYISPVANFGTHPLSTKTIWSILCWLLLCHPLHPISGFVACLTLIWPSLWHWDSQVEAKVF